MTPTNVRKTPDEMVQTVVASRAERDATGTKTHFDLAMNIAFDCTVQGVGSKVRSGAQRLGNER
jgi:hypothetical protein